jgi:hypothetical protein
MRTIWNVCPSIYALHCAGVSSEREMMSQIGYLGYFPASEGIKVVVRGSDGLHHLLSSEVTVYDTVKQATLKLWRLRTSQDYKEIVGKLFILCPPGFFVLGVKIVSATAVKDSNLLFLSFPPFF